MASSSAIRTKGEPASEDTEVRVAYDDDALYVAARLRDRTPAAIVRQLSRRDAAVEADAFILYLDPHHDHLTGAQFGVSAAGVQRDALIYNDSFLDTTWDAVWASAGRVDAEGWAVEMRIPLSQLRFPRPNATPGASTCSASIQRRTESDWLQLVRKNESGLASRMALLEGIAGIDAALDAGVAAVRDLARRVRRADAGRATPFNDGSRLFGAAGLDLKYGVTSSLALTPRSTPTSARWRWIPPSST